MFTFTFKRLFVGLLLFLASSVSLYAQKFSADVFTTIIHDTQVQTEFGPYQHAPATNNGIGLGIGYTLNSIGTFKISASFVNKNIATTENNQVTGGFGNSKTVVGSSQFMYRLKYEPTIIFGSGVVKLQPTVSLDLIQNRHLESTGTSGSAVSIGNPPELVYSLESEEIERHRMITHPFITLGTDIRIKKSFYLGVGYRIPLVGDYLTRDFTYILNGNAPSQQRITIPGFALMFNVGFSFSLGE